MKESNQNETMTDKELRDFVLNLRLNGYKPDESVWSLSISFVNYVCGENFCLLYTENSEGYNIEAYNINKVYDLHCREDNCTKDNHAIQSNTKTAWQRNSNDD